ncbi:hypothetical protein M409DRAFT_22065 [Zasmidium cellare ATCC 36951]|uniref:Heterokaryon incompatibility domain-containing protein n=1 Tax=Zasmidium cellare ATCC 36951 TaxID=1080233 RepID=A0A6A6CQ73_ZASCE|nr:uncharacterized protein M409DRAFT_22065 [Zasmidium cellare ATCC 36951]KAF2167919.1 hypothetical protein M409DRAFT_22065 [Zasmidium cellare ATCC 36951]
MLCQVCSGAFRDFPDITEEQPHHATFARLKEAADAGCPLCFAFCNLFSDVQHRQLSQADSKTSPCAVHSFVRTSRHDYKFFIHGNNIPRSISSRPFAMFNVSPVDSQSHVLDGTPMTPLHRNTSSDETWDMIAGWIETCMTSHPKCKVDPQQSWYPSRLIRFDHARQRACVLETAENVCIGAYLTLSYRWQNMPTFLLTTHTHKAMSNGFPISSMPRVFRDAATVCARLGIYLLWIDALCIRQDADDESDWRKESLQMDKVYSKALLNISAAAASDGTCSLFVERNPLVLHEPTISTTIDLMDKRYHLTNDSLWDAEVGNAPLNLRGWVFQERLLAQRTLQFGRNQVTWECAEMAAAESSPGGIFWRMPETHGISANFVEHLKTIEHAKDISGRREVYRTWGRIIESYSRCSLTQSKDKLVALAGIAKVFSPFVRTQYVAGMWRNDLEKALLWSTSTFVHDVDHPSRCVETYIAPSWSWASIVGTVSMPSQVMALEYRWEVLDVALELASEDEMSEVRNASLLLKCDLFKVTVTRDWSMPSAFESRIFSFLGPDGETNKMTLSVVWDASRDSANLEGSELYLASAVHMFGATQEIPDVHGLLLRPADDSGRRDTYRRCAYFSTLYGAEAAADAKMFQGGMDMRCDIPCVRRVGSSCVIRLI